MSSCIYENGGNGGECIWGILIIEYIGYINY